MITLIFAMFMIEGSSVEPAYMHNEIIHTINAPCPEGDYIAFTYEGERYIKQLKHYHDDGSIWVEGRKDMWIKNDKIVESYDSTVYGYIPADEYNILGCVK